MNRFILALLCWVLSAAPASVKADEPVKSEVKSKPEIVVQRIDASERVTVGRTVRIRVTIKNGNETISLERVAVSPPPALRLKLGGKTDSPFSLNFPPERSQLNPGEVLELGEVDLVGPSLFERVNWDLLAYRPKKETILGELSYVSLAGNVPARAFHSLDVDAFASPLGVFAGAIVGTFLGALFVTMVRVQKAVEALQSPKRADVAAIIGKEAGRAGFIFIKATVAAGIVILVLQSASGVKFPIEVSVNDFYGGLVMGLVGERVASAVYEWITKP